MLNDIIFVSLIIVGVLFVCGKYELDEWAYQLLGWQVFRCNFCMSFWANLLVMIFILPPWLILPAALAGASFGTPFLMVLKRGI